MRRSNLILLIAGLIVSGCGTAEPTRTTNGHTSKPMLADVSVANIPFHPQKGFGCGAPAMASALAGAGMIITPESLAERFTGETGDPRPVLIDTARHYGQFAAPIHGMESLREELEAGHPVLIVENLGVAHKPLWNCAIAIGTQDNGTKIVVHEGEQQSKAINKSTLDLMWMETDNWGLVIMPPGELPATSGKTDVMEAANGLAQSGHYGESIKVFNAILAKWPSDPDARMGLGTCLYLSGDLRGAANSYRLAAAFSPNPRPSLAALDHVNAEMGLPKPELAKPGLAKSEQEIAAFPPPKNQEKSSRRPPR